MRGVAGKVVAGVSSSTLPSKVFAQKAAGQVLLSIATVMLLVVRGPQAAPLDVRPEPAPPEVVNAAVPFYPRAPQVGHIEGKVVLRISTDGVYAHSIEVVEGPPMLAAAAKRNVSTWQFKPHKATTFDATFRYHLLKVACGPGCDCRSAERPTISLRLPTEVEVNAEAVALCDPAEKR